MHRYVLAALVIPVSIASVTRNASADESIDSSPDDKAAVASPSLRVDTGLFSPIGSVGLVYSRPVHRLAAIEGGVGLGFSGVQLSGMVKLRAGNERTKFTPGIGLSVGLPLMSAVHEGHPPGDDEMSGAPVSMAWLDIDLLGVEHRTQSGIVLSASAGVTVALTEGHWDAADLGDDVQPLDVLPQFRIGAGKAF